MYLVGTQITPVLVESAEIASSDKPVVPRPSARRGGRGIAAARHNNAADARSIVARIEGVPSAVQIGLDQALKSIGSAIPGYRCRRDGRYAACRDMPVDMRKFLPLGGLHGIFSPLIDHGIVRGMAQVSTSDSFESIVDGLQGVGLSRAPIDRQKGLVQSMQRKRTG